MHPPPCRSIEYRRCFIGFISEYSFNIGEGMSNILDKNISAEKMPCRDIGNTYLAE